MSMNKRLKLVIGALIILLVALSSAAYIGGWLKIPRPEVAGEEQIYQGYPRTIVDSAGRTVTITRPITRIITLTSDSAECVRTLGEVEKIVGVTETILEGEGGLYFQELKGRPVVGTWKEYDYEKIVAIAKGDSDRVTPDLLVVCYAARASEVSERLNPFGIPVVGLDFYIPSSMEAEVEKLGYILDREAEARKFITWRQHKEDAVRRAVAGLERPRVYLERGASTDIGELGTYGQGSALNEFCNLAGGANIASELEAQYPKVGWEWVMSQNPAVIIKEEPKTFIGVSSMAEELRTELMNRPGAGNVSAIRDGRVYILTYKITYGLGNVVGLTYWAQLFHPELDLDPETVYREYLEEFQGMVYPAEIQVVYPELPR
ncbi:MAG: ABC transporter substrate-binding protein [Methanophagales archaeon ANME-1-THS]|nr:MAG: ABC transporter substrate-binding protein [Methanophagales archaeon ANME-1-THS]